MAKPNGLAIVLESAKAAGKGMPSGKAPAEADDDSPGAMLIEALEAKDGRAVERAVRLIMGSSDDDEADEADVEDEG